MRRKPLILIVDEDPYLAGIYGRRMEMQGCRVLVAETIAAAKKALKKDKPDAVTVDISVEGKAGLEFVKELRADPATRTTPVVVITALGDRKSIGLAKKVGADAYLIKGHFVPSEAAEKVVKLVIK